MLVGQWQRFNLPTSQSAVRLLAVHLINQTGIYTQQRGEAIAQFCASPHYQTSRRKRKMLNRFIARRPLAIREPLRAAFALLSRAVQIQAENCKKKAYETYYPTTYLSENYGFQRSVEYAVKEQRSLRVHCDDNELLLYHCTMKSLLAGYMDKATETLRKYGFQRALNTLRKSYRQYRRHLASTPLSSEAKERYRQRFLQQMTCIFQPSK